MTITQQCPGHFLAGLNLALCCCALKPWDCHNMSLCILLQPWVSTGCMMRQDILQTDPAQTQTVTAVVAVDPWGSKEAELASPGAGP